MAKKRARTERREAGRAAVKVAEARVKLASLEPGGKLEHPIVVGSASVIEVHAAGLPCAACGASGSRVEEHVAEHGLRIARVRCQRCGFQRDIFFRIALPS